MNATNQSDLSYFEAAIIKDGGLVNVVLRRRGLPIMDRLDPTTRWSVEVYTNVAEGVMAGGATMPSDTLSGGCTGGQPSKEGRQASVLDQVRFLRHMETAVAGVQVTVGRASPVKVDPLHLWRRVCLGDVSMARYLRGLGLKPAKSRVADLNAAFVQIADRVADAIGGDRAPG